MIDPVTNNAKATTFSNLEKVAVDLLVKKDYGLINFHIALANYEILAVHLLKSGEWIYGLYSGWQYQGYLYLGTTLTIEQQFSCVTDFLPKDFEKLSEFERIYKHRIDYYISSPDAFFILTEEQTKRKFLKKKT